MGRRRFSSQSACIETNAVATVVESLALSRPEVGFFLRSDGRRSLALPASADLRERISQVHGLSLARSLLVLEDPVVWGFVSPLAVSFPTRCYLPSYSPDYNPIEAAFAKIKNLLRKAAARTKEAIGVALSVVSAEDARGFFEHAGYRSTGHFL